jgi:hypothetical protein
MLHRIAAITVAALLASVSAYAQSPTSKPAAGGDKATISFVGEWEGTYQTDHGPGGSMSMRIAKDSIWKATAEVLSGSQAMPTRVTNVSVEGNTITWTQELMGMSCKASAVLDGTEMKGTTACEHGSMTMVMRKK